MTAALILHCALDHPNYCLSGAFWVCCGNKSRGSRPPRMICPQCRSTDCFRSHRDGVSDFLSTFAGLRPWRCHTCDKRFYSRRVPITFSCYAHCPKCGNFDLEHISRERVEQGTFMVLKRWIGIPAYRCDPCRTRFFSVLPFRRIRPSLIPIYDRRAGAGSKGPSERSPVSSV
jgi:hypothetical protein